MSENAYEMIGRITVAWNKIESYWHDIFQAVLHVPKREADALYLHVTNTALLHTMALRLGEVKLDPDGPALRRLKAFSKATGENASKRNVAIHSRYAGSDVSLDLVALEPFKLPIGPNDLTDKDVINGLRQTLAALTTLESDAFPTLAAIWTELGEPPT